MNKDSTQLENVLGYAFTDKTILTKALTHTSYAYEHGVCYSNERLELLGDAVLQLALTEFLMTIYKDEDEGQLSELRAYCVAESCLYRCAAHLGIGDFLLLGNGEISSGGVNKRSLLADTFEAIIAAIHLDGGYKEAKAFILRNLTDILMKVHDTGEHIDHKSRLQHITQKRYGILPTYRVLEERGPSHDKVFTIECSVRTPVGLLKAQSIGKNKKVAEKAAATKLIDLLPGKKA
ncbi:ribonuclease III [Deferribacterales bacterium RsTz2092]|nr:ribonuclease 3 [Deferribacterales bacterium]